MKKLYSIAFSALALFALSTACSKEEKSIAENNGTKPAAEKITISATLSDVLTKVAYTDSDGAGLTLAWEEGDKLLVVNHANPSNDAQEFTLLPEDIGKQTGRFTGTLPAGATIFDVSVVHATTDYSVQTQPKDGDLSALELIAYAEEVDDITNFVLTDHSSILKIEAKLPVDVAGTITSVQIKAIDNTDVTGATPSNIFFGGNTLTINLGEKADVDSDNILKLYATIPDKDSDPSNTAFIIKFISDSEHSEYTRFVVLKDGATLDPMAVHTLKINCSNIDKHAGVKDADGSENKPYLIADKYQLMAVKDLLEEGVTKYFVLVEDIDMSGLTWAPLNPTSPYNLPVNFDGNHKTISNLSGSLFYLVYGTVKDLTLDTFSITNRGALADYIQKTGNVITNVHVKNGSISSGDTNTGGLIGCINNGTDASAYTATITDCTVSNTNVSGTGVIGGLVGFANEKVLISGCTYTGGTVTASARFCGGLIASTGNYDSVISDCHVEIATISSTVTKNDFRAGGFIGQQQTKVRIEGCTVGTADKDVNVSLSAPSSGKVYNSGGFVGTAYGTITKNGDVRSEAYVTVTAGNTATGAQLNLGGFAGYHTGTIEYSDAHVTMSSLKGIYIGGFSGYVLANGVASNCTESGTVSGNNYTGGFVGVVDSGSFTNCSSAGTVSAQSSIGGFIGGVTADKFTSATITGNHSSVTVTSSGSNAGGFGGTLAGTYTSNYATGDVTSTTGGTIGGFAGQIMEKFSATFSKNYATGNVTGTTNIGGLIGYIGGNLTMSDCFATGNVGTSSKYNQKYGGLVGYTTDKSENSEGITITNCYAAGNVENSFAGGGLIGRIGLASCSVSNCAAWGSSVKAHTIASNAWSTAAVVGVAFPKCTLTGNYRIPGMAVTAYWGTETGYTTLLTATFDHADVSSEHPLTDSTGAEMGDTSTSSGQAHYPIYPYHGHYTSETNLSTLASTTLGWSSDVWNFEGPLPILK